ncbi:hypothetical protein [Desulfobulbus propionicus]
MGYEARNVVLKAFYENEKNGGLIKKISTCETAYRQNEAGQKMSFSPIVAKMTPFIATTAAAMIAIRRRS